MRFVADWRKSENGYSTMPNANNPTPVASAVNDEKAECAETIGVNEVAQPRDEPSRDEED